MKPRRRRRRHRPWRPTINLIRSEIADELLTIKTKRLEVAAWTATRNLLDAQADASRLAIRRAMRRLAGLRRDLKRGVKADSEG